jgi:hypothetical protein
MRVLSAGRSSSGGGVVVTPPREDAREGLSNQPASAPGAGSSAVAIPVTRAAMRAAAARRRRVLRVLVALTLLTGAMSVFGAIPRWSVAVPVLLIVAFLVVARRQVRIANESYWQRAADVRPAASNVERRPGAARVEASHGAARKRSGDRSTKSDGDTGGVPAEPEEAEPDDGEPTITLTAEQVAAAAGLSEERAAAVSVHTADGGSLWDPLPITLPTYVEKTVAKRSVRKIAIGEAGTWSSGHSPAASARAASASQQAVEASPDASVTDKADEEIESVDADERPRAANA